MGKGDALASGAKSASFMMGGDSKDAPIELKNVAPVEEQIQSHVDNSHLFKKRAPQVFYKGRPLGDMVLVKRIPRKSNSMIIIPDSAQGKSDIGIVSAAGAVAQVKDGDLVLFDKFASVGNEVSLMDENGDEQEYLLLRNHDILLILEEVRPSKNGPCVQ